MSEGWLPGAEAMNVLIGVWVVVVLAYGGWRSRSDAPADPIREPGPIWRS